MLLTACAPARAVRHGCSFQPLPAGLHSCACVMELHSAECRLASDRLHAHASCKEGSLPSWYCSLASVLRLAWCVQQYDDVSTLRDVFEKFGRCSEVHLPRNKQTGNPKGFGFIEYHTSRHADGYARSPHVLRSSTRAWTVRIVVIRLYVCLVGLHH